MTDIFSRRKRSTVMAAIRSRQTAPERTVQHALRNLGFALRLHSRNLPGTPDIVIRGVKTAVFVHGCFWHQHQGCKRCTMPSTNRAYWTAKLTKNVARGKKVKSLLRRLGWQVIEVWECETKADDRLRRLLIRKLGIRPST